MQPVVLESHIHCSKSGRVGHGEINYNHLLFLDMLVLGPQQTWM